MIALVSEDNLPAIVMATITLAPTAQSVTDLVDVT